MDTQFAKFLQIGIIVENTEETIKHFEEYGIGPWTVNHLDSDKLPGEFTMNGKNERLEAILGFCQIWGFEIELIQPVSDSPYMDWFKEHGTGMHHIALITRDGFRDVLAEHKQLTGRDPWIWCRNKDIGMEFAYLDLRMETGLFLEVYDEEKHGGLAMDFQVPENVSGGAASDTQFARFLKLGMVVENVDEAIKHYEEYGVGNWTKFHFDSDKFPGDFKVNGEKGRLELILGNRQCWGFELELIQPVSEGPFMDFLREHGPGMHHIAVVTKDSFEDVIAQHEQLTGRKPWLWCSDEEMGLAFAYLDLYKELGFFLEIYNEEKNGGIPADFRVPADE